jgi:hypothetical protein
LALSGSPYVAKRHVLTGRSIKPSGGSWRRGGREMSPAIEGSYIGDHSEINEIRMTNDGKTLTISISLLGIAFLIHFTATK